MTKQITIAVPKGYLLKEEPAENIELTTSAINERLKYIKPGKGAFNSNIPKRLQLNVKGAKISQIYRR